MEAPRKFNFVNLGRLYSLKPWWHMAKTLRSFDTSPEAIEAKTPAGWAYLEDGSVYISPQGWLSHDVLEARMKFAAAFCQPRNSSTDQEKKRSIIFTTDNSTNLKPGRSYIRARHAKDGEKLFRSASRFRGYTLGFNESGVLFVNPEYGNYVQPNSGQRLGVLEALKYFRGTFVDGILQPNVRLGNGLRISPPDHEEDTKAGDKPQKTVETSEGSDADEGPSKKGLKSKSGAPKSIADLADWQVRFERKQKELMRIQRELLLMQQQIVQMTLDAARPSKTTSDASKKRQARKKPATQNLVESSNAAQAAEGGGERSEVPDSSQAAAPAPENKADASTEADSTPVINLDDPTQNDNHDGDAKVNSN